MAEMKTEARPLDGAEVLAKLERVEALLVTLVERQTIKDWYEIEEFARPVGKTPYTVREWARLGRINAEKRLSGRGAYPCWAVGHDELLRYRREGLLPLRPASGTRR